MKRSDRFRKVIGTLIALGIIIAIGIIFFFVNTNYEKMDSVEPTPTPTITNHYADVLIVPDSKLDFTRTEVTTKPAPKPEIVKPVPPEQTLLKPIVPVPVKPPVVTVGPEMAWVNATTKKYGVYAEPRTVFKFGPIPIRCAVNGRNADACVITDKITYTDGRVEIVGITLYMDSNKLTEYLLFHEIAHTQGIYDECAADKFAAGVLGTAPGSGYYC
jgi:hypothetical protein